MCRNIKTLFNFEPPVTEEEMDLLAEAQLEEESEEEEAEEVPSPEEGPGFEGE